MPLLRVYCYESSQLTISGRCYDELQRTSNRTSPSSVSCISRCSVPRGMLSADHKPAAFFESAETSFPSAILKAEFGAPRPHEKPLFAPPIPHGPLLDLKVKSPPACTWRRNVAQLEPTRVLYHLPLLIKHPLSPPFSNFMTRRPFPVGLPVSPGGCEPVVVGPGRSDRSRLGRYLIPSSGQVSFSPPTPEKSGSLATNSPSCNEPRTTK